MKADRAALRPKGEIVTRHKYTPQEVERGLVALALVSGNARRASKALAEQGLKVPPTTLRDWRSKTHREKYLEVQEDTLPALRARAAELHMELAERQVQLSGKMAERLERTYEDLDPRDLSTAMRNVDVGSGIHTQRASELRGEPNLRVQKLHDPLDILRALKARGQPITPDQQAALEGTATELEPDKEEDGQ